MPLTRSKILQQVRNTSIITQVFSENLTCQQEKCNLYHLTTIKGQESSGVPDLLVEHGSYHKPRLLPQLDNQPQRQAPSNKVLQLASRFFSRNRMHYFNCWLYSWTSEKVLGITQRKKPWWERKAELHCWAAEKAQDLRSTKRCFVRCHKQHAAMCSSTLCSRRLLFSSMRLRGLHSACFQLCLSAKLRLFHCSNSFHSPCFLQGKSLTLHSDQAFHKFTSVRPRMLVHKFPFG